MQGEDFSGFRSNARAILNRRSRVLKLFSWSLEQYGTGCHSHSMDNGD
jgi:hypothetical protein